MLIRENTYLLNLCVAMSSRGKCKDRMHSLVTETRGCESLRRMEPGSHRGHEGKPDRLFLGFVSEMDDYLISLTSCWFFNGGKLVIAQPCKVPGYSL